MTFGRGGPRVYAPWWLLLLAFPFICAFYAIVAVVWLVAHVVAGLIVGVVWLAQRAAR